MKHSYSSDTPGEFRGKIAHDSRIGASFIKTKNEIGENIEFICHSISKKCSFVPMVMLLSLLLTVCSLLPFINYFHASNGKAVFTNDLHQLLRTSFKKEANITKLSNKEKVPYSSNDKAVFTNELPQLMRTSVKKEANITKFSKKEKLPFVLHYSWKEATISSSWNQCKVDQIKYYNDEDVDKFVRQHRPSYYPSFQEKLSKIEKMDYFRYLLIYINGGFWVDVDVECVSPVDKWLAKFGFSNNIDIASLDFVFGLEFPNAQKDYNETGVLPFQLTQYTFGACQKSNMMLRILEYLEKVTTNSMAFEGDTDSIVLQRTGPAAFTKAIVDEIISHGIPPGIAPSAKDINYPLALLPMNTLNQNGQLLTLSTSSGENDNKLYRGVILPYRAFSYHRLHNSGQEPELTRHMFWGSWK